MFISCITRLHEESNLEDSPRLIPTHPAFLLVRSEELDRGPVEEAPSGKAVAGVSHEERVHPKSQSALPASDLRGSREERSEVGGRRRTRNAGGREEFGFREEVESQIEVGKKVREKEIVKNCVNIVAFRFFLSDRLLRSIGSLEL